MCCLYSAEEIRKALQTKHLLARIAPARLFYKTASEALRAIKVSCLTRRQVTQVDRRTDILSRKGMSVPPFGPLYRPKHL